MCCARDCAGEVCRPERGLGRACEWHPVPRSTLCGRWWCPKAASGAPLRVCEPAACARRMKGRCECSWRADDGDRGGDGDSASAGAGVGERQVAEERVALQAQAQQMLMQNRACCVRALRCACSLQSTRKRLPHAPALARDGACMAYHHVYFNFRFLERYSSQGRGSAVPESVWATLTPEHTAEHRCRPCRT